MGDISPPYLNICYISRVRRKEKKSRVTTDQIFFFQLTTITSSSKKLVYKLCKFRWYSPTDRKSVSSLIIRSPIKIVIMIVVMIVIISEKTYCFLNFLN